MRDIKLIFCGLCIVLLAFVSASAQQQPQSDPFAGNLFPPELIMQHQQAIGLSEEQKNFVKTELQKAQIRLTELQWGLQEEVEKLSASVKQDQVDESLALTQLDKVLAIEREIKRTHIGLLLRIKNKLTTAQLARLREITNKTRG